MVPRDPLVQSWCTKEQPYARANLLEPIIENPGNTRGGGGRNKLLVADSQTDYAGV